VRVENEGGAAVTARWSRSGIHGPRVSTPGPLPMMGEGVYGRTVADRGRKEGGLGDDFTGRWRLQQRNLATAWGNIWRRKDRTAWMRWHAWVVPSTHSMPGALLRKPIAFCRCSEGGEGR
jgi:hypothetical protein